MLKYSRTNLLNQTFLAFFIAQLFSAFNDNACSIIAVTCLIHQGHSHLAFITTALFALPFFLFSATAGRMADRYSKFSAMQIIKLAEWGIHAGLLMAIICQHNLLTCVFIFLAGANSAFFGPLKYSVIPYLTSEAKLAKVNGIIAGSTFIFILVGILLGSFFATTRQSLVGFSVFIIIASGFSALVLLLAKKDEATTPDLLISWRFWHDTFANIKLTLQQQHHLFLIIVYISFFWAIGGGIVNLITAFNHTIWQSDAVLRTIALLLFTLSVGLGCYASNRLMPATFSPKAQINCLIGACLGLLTFACFLAMYPQSSASSWFLVISHPLWLLSIIAFLFASFCAGVYIIPLYTYLQQNSPKHILGQIMANSNIVYAIIMTLLSLFSSGLLKYGVSAIGVLLLYVLIWVVTMVSTKQTFA